MVSVAVFLTSSFTFKKYFEISPGLGWEIRGFICEVAIINYVEKEKC